MTTDHHTPIATGAPAKAAVLNIPLGQLDAVLAVMGGLDEVHVSRLYESDDGAVALSADASGELSGPQDLYLIDGRKAVQKQLDAYTSWGWNCSDGLPATGWAWASDGVFSGTPAAISTIDGHVVVGVGGATTSHFYYHAIDTFASTIHARLTSVPPVAPIVGVRIDDSTAPSTRYAQMYLTWVANAGLKVEGDWNNGSGASTVILGASYPPTLLFNLQLTTGGTNGSSWNITTDIGTQYSYQYVGSLGSGKTWTADRIGYFIVPGSTNRSMQLLNLGGGMVSTWA